MADPMRIRAQAAGDKATRPVLMSHEMDKSVNAKMARQNHPRLVHSGCGRNPERKAVMTAQWAARGREYRSCNSTSRLPRASSKVSYFLDQQQRRQTH